MKFFWQRHKEHKARIDLEESKQHLNEQIARRPKVDNVVRKSSQIIHDNHLAPKIFVALSGGK